MNLNLSKFYPHRHYKECVEWWENQGWPPVEIEVLPENGVVVEGVCAGWIYKTDSICAIVDWIITNPKVGMKVRHQGLELLIPALKKMATIDLGYPVLMSFVHENGLKKRLQKHGFIVGDKQVFTMIFKGV